MAVSGKIPEGGVIGIAGNAHFFLIFNHQKGEILRLQGLQLMLKGFKAVRLVIPCGKAAQYFSIVNRQNSGQVLLYSRADDQRHGSFKTEKEALLDALRIKKARLTSCFFCIRKAD
jgi:hypothetical protein